MFIRWFQPQGCACGADLGQGSGAPWHHLHPSRPLGGHPHIDISRDRTFPEKLPRLQPSVSGALVVSLPSRGARSGGHPLWASSGSSMANKRICCLARLFTPLRSHPLSCLLVAGSSPDYRGQGLHSKGWRGPWLLPVSRLVSFCRPYPVLSTEGQSLLNNIVKV